MEYLIIIISLIILLFYKENQNAKLIKDLSLKIKCKDMDEYLRTTADETTIKENKVKDNDLIPLDESPVWDDKQEFLRAIGEIKGGKDAQDE